MPKSIFYLILLIVTVSGVAYLNYIQPNKRSALTQSNQNKVNASRNTPIKINNKKADTIADKEPVLRKNNFPNKPSVVNGKEKAVKDKTQIKTSSDAESVKKIDESTKKVVHAQVAKQETLAGERIIENENIKNQTSTIRVLLIPNRETTLSSTISSRIISMRSSLGQRFKAGTSLVAFDCDQSHARVEIAKATLAGTIEEHEAKLRMQGLNQASDVEVALAASAVNKAKAELKLNRTQVSECKIYAPWHGRIAKSYVKTNMTVNPGEPLLDIVDTGPLKIKINIPSRLLSEVKIGDHFDVTIDETGKTYDAVIKAINSRIDSVSQTVEIEAKMSKAHATLLPGMSGTADFTKLGIYQ